MCPPSLAGDRIAKFRSQLLRWYRTDYRKLPWRETADPYAIWVSEIMLQQTTVATVVNFYRRFLEQFPTVQLLAMAQRAQVLQLWSGLGYYRRAKNLHLAAQQITGELNGRFPQTVDELLRLQGVGRYTAGAIASFAFDVPAPIIEANTARLHARLLAIDQPLKSTQVQQRLWQNAFDLLPKKQNAGAGKVNQALIELGSQICTPTNPDCVRCPVKNYCLSFSSGVQDRIPIAQPPKTYHQRTHLALLIRDRRGRLLLRQNAGSWWDGLWDLPWVQTDFCFDKIPSQAQRAEAERIFQTELGLACRLVQQQLSMRHTVTNNRIHLRCWQASLESFAIGKKSGWCWASIDNIPAATSRLKKILTKL